MTHLNQAEATRPGPDVVEVDRNGLEVLDRDQCLRLLATATVGRLAVSFGALPTILPVNFRLVGEDVAFRTTIGTKLDAATCNAVVAFEVDEIDPVYHTGWSVVVVGMAREVSDPTELARFDGARIPRWAPVPAERVVVISTEMVSGRQIVPGRPHPQPTRSGPTRAE